MAWLALACSRNALREETAGSRVIGLLLASHAGGHRGPDGRGAPRGRAGTAATEPRPRPVLKSAPSGRSLRLGTDPRVFSPESCAADWKKFVEALLHQLSEDGRVACAAERTSVPRE